MFVIITDLKNITKLRFFGIWHRAYFVKNNRLKYSRKKYSTTFLIWCSEDPSEVPPGEIPVVVICGGSIDNITGLIHLFCLVLKKK